MTTDEVRMLPMVQKLQIMEALWDDLRDRFERSEPSPRIKELLDQRRSSARDAAGQLLDWDTVKSTIGRL